MYKRQAICACSWKVVRRKKTPIYQLKIATPDGLQSVEYLPRKSAIGFDIVRMVLQYTDQIPLISIEDVYFGKNVKSSVSLARMGGMICSPIEQSFYTKAEWVMAPEWRQLVLGLKRNSGREAAKQASLSLIPAKIKMMRSILDHLGEMDNITDAAGIAAWLKIKKEQENEGEEK